MSLRALAWFLIGFALMLVVGLATAGYSLGDGKCYDTQASAQQGALRSFQRFLSANTDLISLSTPCTHSDGPPARYSCTLYDSTGTSVDTFALIYAACDIDQQDFDLNTYWLAPAVLLFFVLGWKLGMTR